MHVGRGLEQQAILLRSHPVLKDIGRNPVGALGEEGHAVRLEVEALAPLVGLTDEMKRAQADPLFHASSAAPAPSCNVHRHGVERLLAQITRPPELGMLD